MGKFISRTITIGAILCSVCFVTYNFYGVTKVEDASTKNVKQNNNVLSMMLETKAKSGQYEVTASSSWPTDGYIFNSELSKCENGGTLIWDDTNNKVIMKGNISDKCYAYFDKYDLITINDSTITTNGNNITIIIDAISGTGTISKYYYSKDDGETYLESTSNNYVFTGLDKGIYKVRAYVEDSNGKRSKIISKTIEIDSLPLIDFILSQYNNIQGNNGILYHDSSLTNGAEDNSYRYVGENPNNYICLNLNEETCSEDNLYRIIGVFGENNHGVTGEKLIKVIKNTSYGKLSWDTANSNTWNRASLKETLNSTFIAEKLSGMEDKIAEVSWKVGGYRTNAATTKAISDVEVIGATNIISAKIGLMYASDYGFATTQDYWTVNLNDYDSAAYQKDWLFSGILEWILSPCSSTSKSAWYVSSNGSVPFSSSVTMNSHAVRPTFYLQSSIQYYSGDGTISNPIRLKK